MDAMYACNDGVVITVIGQNASKMQCPLNKTLLNIYSGYLTPLEQMKIERVF